MGHSGLNMVTWGHLMTFSGAERPDTELVGASKGLFCSHNGFLGTFRGAPKDWKWVSDAYLAKMGQLDYHVVFGTKSGALQDFQRGKKHPTGVKQTPLDPPRPPKTPPNPLKTPPNLPKTNY